MNYEILDGKAYLVLYRKNEYADTEKCSFCKRHHSHGTGDGHRVPHCPDKKEKSVIATDGTILYQEDGYIIRTGEIGSTVNEVDPREAKVWINGKEQS